MKTVTLFFVTHLVVAVAALAVGLALSGLLVVALFVVFVSSFWFFSQQRGVHGLETLFLFGFILAAVSGFWTHAPSFLMLFSTVAALGAWDLDQFLQRLNSVKRVEMETGLGSAHLRRLMLVEVIGVLVGSVALSARIQLDFWVAGILVLIAVIGLSRLVAYLRREVG